MRCTRINNNELINLKVILKQICNGIDENRLIFTRFN